jgi:hypothetical protein
MKRIDSYFFYFLTLGIISVFLFGVPTVPHFKTAHKHLTPTAEQRTSHKITFLDEKGEKLSICTGTAIGPNSFLTAEHCNEFGKAKMVAFDLATEKHVLLAHTYDNRDHVIYLFYGTSFTNIETVKASKTAVVGETVTIYGNILGEYPAISRYGKVIECDDPSDLDAASGEVCYSLRVDSGDSGSAVFNTKGEIVGVITWSHEEDNGSVSAIGFSLNFDAEKLYIARTFGPLIQ